LRFTEVEADLIPGQRAATTGVDDLDRALSSDDSVFAFFAGGSSAEAVGRRERSGGTNRFIAEFFAESAVGSRV